MLDTITMLKEAVEIAHSRGAFLESEITQINPYHTIAIEFIKSQGRNLREVRENEAVQGTVEIVQSETKPYIRHDLIQNANVGAMQRTLQNLGM